jgi:hypothetical protein
MSLVFNDVETNGSHHLMEIEIDDQHKGGNEAKSVNVEIILDGRLLNVPDKVLFQRLVRNIGNVLLRPGDMLFGSHEPCNSQNFQTDESKEDAEGVLASTEAIAATSGLLVYSSCDGSDSCVTDGRAELHPGVKDGANGPGNFGWCGTEDGDADTENRAVR